MAVALERLPDDTSAEYPKNVLLSPEIFLIPAPIPIPTLKLPIVFA